MNYYYYYYYYYYYFRGATAASGPRLPHYRGFTITLRHTTLGRTPLDAGPARRRNLYLTTYNTHKRQTSMPSAGFEPAMPVSERPQTHALDRAATGNGECITVPRYVSSNSVINFILSSPCIFFTTHKLHTNEMHNIFTFCSLTPTYVSAFTRLSS
jgi:hypothetical protein